MMDLDRKIRELDGAMSEACQIIRSQAARIKTLEEEAQRDKDHEKVRKYINEQEQEIMRLRRRVTELTAELENAKADMKDLLMEIQALIDKERQKHNGQSACNGCENKGSDDCVLGKPGWENAFCPNGKLTK